MMNPTQPAPSPLYPSLMAVPELSAEQRIEFERLAQDHMRAGTAAMAAAFEQLTAAMAANNYAGIDEANARLREGRAQLESGLSVQRALREGRAPRDIALDWFRREMNLVPRASDAPPHGIFGLSWFHYITMFILSAFAGTMGWAYVQKMRRAEALVARLAPPAPATPADITEERAESPQAAESSFAESAATAPVVHPDVAPSPSNSWTGLLRVARIFDETRTVKTFRLTDPAGGSLPFTYLPGQFLTLTVMPNGHRTKRSYSIASAPTTRDACEITVRREEQGAVSRFLHDHVAEGDTLQVTAPSGKFTFTGQETNRVVLIAGGVGITPMMSVIRYLTSRSWPGDVYLVYATRHAEDIIFGEELAYLQRRYPNLHVTIVVEDATSAMPHHATGRITRDLLESAVPDLADKRVHLCGPPPMMDAVQSLLGELGVARAQVHTEVFIGREPRRPAVDTIAAAETTVAVVTFARSRRTAMLPATKTVLEASEDVGVDIDYSCRVGTCGVCKVRLLAGAVAMDVDEALDPADRSQNVILACQAKATADITVDA